MKIVFLTASTSRNAGGLYFTITNYTRFLRNEGVEVYVVGIDDEFSAEDRINFGEVEVKSYKTVRLPLLSTFGMSLELSKLLENLNPDIIHLQGLWMYHSLAALKYRKSHPNSRLIIEPHGMLDPWAVKNSAWKKKLVGHWFEYENLRTADCLHALCESEKESIKNFGLTNKVVVIPNGVNIPAISIDWDSKEKTILFIGRIHPKKGIRQLIEAVKLIQTSEPHVLDNWFFKIAGWNQNGHQEELENLVRSLSLDNVIKFIGPIFGEEKHNELIKASAFILPSFSEGLPMSILEAWAYGLPTIMTPYCNLPIGFESNSAIKIGTSPDEIKDGILKFLTLQEEEVRRMSMNATELVKESFTWKAIAQTTVNLYDELIQSTVYGGTKN